MPLINAGDGSEGCPKAEGWLLDQGSSGRPSGPSSSPSAEGFPHLPAPAPLPVLGLGCSGVGKGVDSGETGSGEKEKKNLFHDAPGMEVVQCRTQVLSQAWGTLHDQSRLSARSWGTLHDQKN